MKGEYIYRKSRGIWAGIVDLCLTEYVPLNGGRQTGGADGDSQMAKRGVWLSWLEWICVLEQWADASGEPRQLSQKAAVVSPL